MTEIKERLAWIRKQLNNTPLLKWVKKHSADGLTERKKADAFDIETNEDTLAISDTAQVKMFFSFARFRGQKYISFNLGQIKEIIDVVGSEGTLLVSDAENPLGYVESGENVIVVAPLSNSDDVTYDGEKVKEEKKEKSKKKQSEEETDDE